MTPVLNVAAYQFAELAGIAALRTQWRELAKSLGLKGTILLSPEGVNLFVAGSREGVQTLLDSIRCVPGLETLKAKESWSDSQPFSRMLVKIKKEIIAFGVPGIAPARYSSRRVSPRELKQWLDEGRDVALVDTRNRYEVEAGAFANAVTLPIDDFREFPRAASGLPHELKNRTIVAYCTGGIRCEKAAPFLEQAGFQDVYQLDGGILRYFEECDSAHFQGECFVFDKRVALDSKLTESRLRQCYRCQAVLSPEEQHSPLYVEGESCPHCHADNPAVAAQKLARRNAEIASALVSPPGCEPYDHQRPICVPLRFDGLGLIPFLEAMRTHLSPAEWIAACREGRLTRRGEQLTPQSTLRAGDHLVHHLPATTEPPVSCDIRVLYEDEQLVVAHKPAPLPVHSSGRFHRNTLTYMLGLIYAPLKLRPVHRLDSDTTGVQVLAKTRSAAQCVQPQFERGEVRKRYLARVIGRPEESRFECRLPLAKGENAAGVRLPAADGDDAHTEFCVLRRDADGTSLLEVIPRTGRTNQIRAHLWALGMPIVGDPIYLPSGQLGGLRSTEVDAARLHLHALELKMRHPATCAVMQFTAPPPAWAKSEPIA